MFDGKHASCRKDTAVTATTIDERAHLGLLAGLLHVPPLDPMELSLLVVPIG
jgi:hypothetical protein